ncbi:MAG: hypothetical protein JF593_15790, partial [Novosphingobium sp.]|nr:hypothetical protein [Novosphingobium sp.]
MTDATPPSRSRHLLAPELAAGLERFPNVDFSHGVAPFRGGGRLENFGGEL